MTLSVNDFDYELPSQLIAQYPLKARDQSRLLVLDRKTRQILHEPSFDRFIEYLHRGDLLILNDSRVVPARLRGHKIGTGGEIEVLLLTETSRNQWWALLKPAKRVRPGTKLLFLNPHRSVTAIVLEKNAEGHCRLEFVTDQNIREELEDLGELPLPPYITRPLEERDRERYQTVFGSKSGSIAAPTAGLHFTRELLSRIQARGVDVHFVTLHVGLGTFAPVKDRSLLNHRMHEEHFTLAATTARAVNEALDAGRRVVAVGTTTVRVLESVAAHHGGRLVEAAGTTRLFIYPPFQFNIVKGLLTNFHLPRSTLLMLVSAFAAPGETQGREWVMAAYAEAVREKYRFFSYGDAMFLF